MPKATTKNRILVLGDAHIKERLSYADYIEDGRQSEEAEVFDFIVEQAKDVQKVVFMGDNLNSRTNSPHAIRKFTNLVERFDDKEVFIISGNHECLVGGKTSIDYLKEIRGKNWHIITTGVETFGDLTFLPWITKTDLETSDNKEATKKITAMLKPGKILFHHYAVSGSKGNSDFLVDNFPEPVLSKTKLEKLFQLVVGGHIHKPSSSEKIIVTGSLFTSEIGEEEKFIFKIDEDTLAYEQIKLPVRPIYKLELETGMPTQDIWDNLEKRSIIKFIIKEKKTTAEIEELNKHLEEFDAHIIIENLPRERKKMHIGKGQAILEFSIEQLLELYGKEREVSLDLLKRGFELVRV